MIQYLHRLRRDEEGQTLVLGAVFGVILALCVMGTVNLGRAVYEKIQLQTACDDGAYSQAAVEARVLNLTAYTNRAMVVHYSSMMAAASYLTWMHFTDVWVHGLFQIMSWIPYIGEVFTVINEVISVILIIIDEAVFAMTPIVSAANLVLYGLQEGAWYALYLNRLSQIPREAHSGDSNADAYRPIWPNMIPLANQTVFSQTRGGLTLPTSSIQSMEILINANNPVVQEARLHMLEIANSAREPWVAYGDRYSNQGWSPLARHWAFKSGVCNANWGVNARTELGTPAPGFNLFSLQNTPGEVYSGSRMQLSIDCTVFFYHAQAIVSLFSMTALDQLIPIGEQSTWQGVQAGGGILARVIKWVLDQMGVTSAFNGLVSYAKNNVAVEAPDWRPMWISPYVFFSPTTKSGPSGGVFALGSGLGNFAQPDVIFGLARQRADFNRPFTSPNHPFGTAQVGGIIKGAGGQVDFSYNGNDWPTIPGLPGPLQLHEGFNALCAAQVYYHRPGDWKEMPNFFNPLWAARLMPVVDSNAGASLGLNKVPLINQFLLH